MKNNRKVIIMNATFDGSTHEMIDSSIIIILSTIFDCAEVKFLSDRSDKICEIVSKRISSSNVVYKPYKINKKKGAVHDLKAALLEAWTILSGSKDVLYISTFNNMFSCHLNNFVSKMTGKKLFMFCHSEVNVIATGKYKITQIWAYLINRFFTKTKYGKNVKLIVLGNHILQSLQLYLKDERLSHFDYIDHPYYRNGSCDCKHKFDKDNIKIGVIGGVSKYSSHGYENILSFSKLLATNKSAKIYLISYVEPQIRNTFPENVEIVNKSNGYLPREKYEEAIDKMDYILLPYSSSEYKLIASGAVLEAIVRCKPTIMYANDYFTYLAQKFGDFGYFVNHEEIIGELENQAKYSQFIERELYISKQISPEQIRKRFIEIL